MVAFDKIFSVLALFIMFRETIEASIICGVLLQFLHRAKPGLKRAVWYGIAAGVIVSIIFGVIFITVYYTAQNNLFSGRSRNLFKGIISWIAAVLITILAFAMLRFLGWEAKWKRKLTAALKEKMTDAADPTAAVSSTEDSTDLPAPADKAAAAASLATSQDPSRKVSSGDCNAAAALTSDEPSRFSRSEPTRGSLSTPSDALTQPQLYQSSAVLSFGPTSCSSEANALCKAKGAASSVGAGKLADDAPSTALVAVDCAVAVKDAAATDLDDVCDTTPPTRKESFRIWILVFTTVVREGIESVVFLGGLGNVKLTAIPLPAFVGIVCGCLVGVFLYYSGRQVRDIKWLVIGMAVVLFFIAAGQVNVGTDALLNANAFGYCSPWLVERPWYMIPVYDWSACCSDTDPSDDDPTGVANRKRFFALVRAIFGYQDKATPIEIILYCGYWSLALAVASFKSWRGTLFDADHKYNREQRKRVKEARQRAAEKAKAAVETAELENKGCDGRWGMDVVPTDP